uniref:Uncharacterized protein n=1 Tax=Anguilla anguilla TaxID=7936 RepID=A0A0E9Q835_ANGAN
MVKKKNGSPCCSVDYRWLKRSNYLTSTMPWKAPPGAAAAGVLISQKYTVEMHC